jgi:hypothetical protein
LLGFWISGFIVITGLARHTWEILAINPANSDEKPVVSTDKLTFELNMETSKFFKTTASSSASFVVADRDSVSLKLPAPLLNGVPAVGSEILADDDLPVLECTLLLLGVARVFVGMSIAVPFSVTGGAVLVVLVILDEPEGVTLLMDDEISVAIAEVLLVFRVMELILDWSLPEMLTWEDATRAEGVLLVAVGITDAKIEVLPVDALKFVNWQVLLRVALMGVVVHVIPLRIIVTEGIVPFPVKGPPLGGKQ